MKKILKLFLFVLLAALYMVVLFVCAKQTLNYFYNNHVVACYEDGDYSINDNLLLTANYIESYVVHYNNGNINYQNKQFEDAIKCYRKALKCDDVPEDKDCDIRINIALSVIGTLPEDYEEYENIDDSIETLLAARDELIENDCANKKGTGHSKDAEKLKTEIEDEIDRLKELKQSIEDQMDEEEKEQREKGDEIRSEKQNNPGDNKGDTSVKKQLKDSAEEAQKLQQHYLEIYREKDAEKGDPDANGGRVW